MTSTALFSSETVPYDAEEFTPEEICWMMEVPTQEIYMRHVPRCNENVYRTSCQPNLCRDFRRARQVGFHGRSSNINEFSKLCLQVNPNMCLFSWEDSLKKQKFSPVLLKLMTDTCSIVVLLGGKNLAVSMETSMVEVVRSFVNKGGVLLLDELSYHFAGEPMRVFINSDECRRSNLHRYPEFRDEIAELDLWRYGRGCIFRCRGSHSAWMKVLNFVLEFEILAPVQDAFDVLNEFVIDSIIPEILAFAFDFTEEEYRHATRSCFFGAFISSLHLEG